MSRELSMNYDESIKQFTISNEDGIVAYGGTMEQCLKNYRLIACKCAPALCPQLTFEEDVDGNINVCITDDYNGCVVMTSEQFEILATKFLSDKKLGII